MATDLPTWDGLQFQGLNDWVLTTPVEAVKVSRGGLHLPDKKDMRPTVVRVVAVGPGKLLPDGTRATPSVVAGDTIIVPEYGVTVCDPCCNGSELRCYRAEEVMAKIVK